VILAHIAMSEDIVPELLRIAQAGAVPEHQPGMRPQHRDVVGDVARIGRADADIDHGDAAIAGLDQMEGRRLRHALRRDACGTAACTARDHVTGLDEGLEAGLAG
jgi:hypothetical protein